MFNIVLLVFGYFLIMRFLRSSSGKRVRFHLEEELRTSFSVKNRDFEKLKKERQQEDAFLDEYYS